MGTRGKSAERFAHAGEITVAQAAKKLGVGESTVHRLLNEDRPGYPSLGGSKRHGCWYLEEGSLEAFTKRYPNFASAE